MNFSFPEYTNFHKFLLIEELALAESPIKLHYGRCNVIGYLSASDTIESLTIPYIQQPYQLPDGTLSLKIFTTFHPKEFLHSTVQIYGEVRVIDKNRDILEENFESSHFLIHKLRELQKALESQEGKQREPTGTNDSRVSLSVRKRIEKEIDSINERYTPLIVVESFRHLTDAKDVIYENLRYRQIRKKMIPF